MRCSPSLILTLMVLVTCGARAQAPDYNNVGRTPSAEEIHAWDNTIGPQGKELPPGKGTAKEGAAIFAERCASCHMPNGEGGPNGVGGPRLAEGSSVGKRMPYATSLWGYINDTMPWRKNAPYKLGAPLKPDEVYAVTALILSWNGIIKDTDVIDAKSLPQVRMPNRDGFVPAMPTYTPNAPNQKP